MGGEGFFFEWESTGSFEQLGLMNASDIRMCWVERSNVDFFFPMNAKKPLTKGS